MSKELKESRRHIARAAEEMADIAFIKGYAEGYASGREKGYEIGYKEGLDDAANAAQDVVKEAIAKHGVMIITDTRRDGDKADDNKE